MAPRERWLRVGGTVAFLAVVVGLAIACVHRDGDMDGFIEVGELILQGKHAYADARPGINTWPPVFGLLCVPIALLARVSLPLTHVLWLGANVVVLLAVLRLLVRIVYRRTLVIRPWRDGVPLASASVLVPVFIAQAGVAGNFYHLQVNLFVFGITLGGLALAARGRSAAGGVALGIAAGIRVMPIVFVPYLLWRRQWKTAFVAGCVALIVFVSPVLVYGPEVFTDYVGSWRAAVTGGWDVGYMNQSLQAMVDRFVGHGFVPFASEPANHLAWSGNVAVAWAVRLALAATALAALWLFRGRMRPGGWVALVEWSVVYIVSAVMGPVCWKAYLVVLVLPLFLLFGIARSPVQTRASRILATVLLAVTFVLLALPSSDLVGSWIAHQFEMGSTFTIGCLLLLVGLFWLRPRVLEPDDAPAEPS